MRLFDLAALARMAAFVSCLALLSGCPKKDDVSPEPAASATPAARAPVNDKAGVEPAAPAAAPAAKKKADDDKGGW